MATTPDIRIRLSAEGLTEVVDALKRVRAESAKVGEGAANGFGSLGKALEHVRGILGALGIATGLVEGVRAISDLLKQSSDLAHELSHTQEQLGGTTAGTVALAAAARITETDTARLKTGIVGLALAARELSAGGTTPATTALKSLGLTARDFKGKELSDQLALVASKMAAVKDGGEKAALAAGIFGRKVGLELIPLLNLLGREGFEGVRKHFGELFSAEAIARVEALREQFAILDLQIHGLALQFLSGLAPAVTHAFEVIDQELAGTGTSALQRFGQLAGVAIAFVILKLDELVDHALFAARALGHLAVIGAQLTVGNISLETLKQLKALLADIADGDKHAADRAKAFKDILTGKLPQPEAPAGGVGIDLTAVNETTKKRLELVKQLADEELKITQARIKGEQDAQQEAFDRGLTGIRAYYETRRRLQQESFDAEAKAARAQADQSVELARAALANDQQAHDQKVRELTSTARLNASGAPVAGAGSSQAQNELEQENLSFRTRQASLEADLETKIADAKGKGALIELKMSELRTKNAGELAQLDREEHDLLITTQREWLSIETKILELRGQHSAVAVTQLDEELRKADLLITKLESVKPPEVIPTPVPGSPDETFVHARDEALAALNDFSARRIQLADDIKNGLLDEATQNARVADLENNRLKTLNDLVDATKRAAAATGKVDNQQQAEDLGRRAQSQAVGSGGLAAINFGAISKRASAVMAELDQRRSEVDDRVSAGLTSQVRGEVEVLRIEQQRVVEVRRLADELRTAAESTNNPDLALLAAKLNEEATALELHIRAVGDFSAKFVATLEDASTKGLADFLGRGIDQANGFRDAILGVLDALRQLASQALARQITNFIAGLFGGAALPSGGTVPGSSGSGGTFLNHAQGGLVTARGTRHRGFARGGLIRGPGGPTSDSISTWVPSGTYIVRAAAVRAPGALVRLRELLRASGSYAGAAIAGGGAIPVRLSNGEFALPPEVVGRPGILAELERLNRGAMTPRLATAHLRGFSGGGLAGIVDGIAGAAGSAGAAGAAGGASLHRVLLDLAPGLIAREVEDVMRSAAGTRLVVETAARAPKSINRALGRG